MKANASLFLVPFSPVFNRDSVIPFEIMDNEHSSYLYSALYLNNTELFEKLNENFNTVLIIDEKDNSNLPDELTAGTIKPVFSDTANFELLFKNLNEKYFSKYAKNIVIFSPAIGLQTGDIQKILDMLSVEDDVVVIGKAENSTVGFIGFTKFHPELFSKLNISGFNYDDYLAVICRHNYFVSVFERSMFIRDWNDFKKLYVELSKKESLSYCSQKMHEMFTHLFIEFKEQIK